MKQRLAAYTAALNRYDLRAVKNMFAENAAYVSPGLNGEIEGRAAIMAAFKTYFAEHVEQVNVDKNVSQISPIKVQSNWSLTATNKRTRKPVARKGLQVITFNAAGLIAFIQVLDF